MVGWLGQFSSGSTPLANFHAHVHDYGSKILKFYQMGDEATIQRLHVFEDRQSILGVLSRLSENSQLLEAFDVTDSHLHFEFNRKRLNSEIEFLKKEGISTVVSLTERHHDSETLKENFDFFHFSVNDLDPPSLDQVHQIAEIIRRARKAQKKIAVHCLAGVGRTSTMLLASHLVLGENLEVLKKAIARQNPSFVFAGKQADFIRSVSERYGAQCPS